MEKRFTEKDIQDEVMIRFDILEELGLSKDVRKNYKKGVLCFGEFQMTDDGKRVTFNRMVDDVPKYRDIFKVLQEKGVVAYYAVKTIFSQYGEVLSVFILNDYNAELESDECIEYEDILEMINEERESLKHGYSLVYSHNFTHDYDECGDTGFFIDNGVAIMKPPIAPL